MVEIRINYETLFDLVRREKSREELQSLDKDFYDQVSAYLREKEGALARKDETLFFSVEKEKLKNQFQNIRRLVKELYERREKKIMQLAMIKARTGSDIIETHTMLPGERAFFDESVALLARYKQEVLQKILDGKDQMVAFERYVAPAEPEPGVKKVKITAYMPKFVGSGGEVLGPFEDGAEVELDDQIATILLRKGKAQLC